MRLLASLSVALMLLTVGVGAFAQADLDTFPIGSTKMVYSIVTEELDQPQILELVVSSHGEDLYSVSMMVEATGTEDQLTSGFGFIFGATTVSSGVGHDVSYSSLQALMDQRERLQEGQDYLLPGGGAFTSIVGVEIATVWCLEGSFVDPEDEDVRMTVAFALSNPTYMSPRIVVEELRDDEWVKTFGLELVEYTVTEGAG